MVFPPEGLWHEFSLTKRKQRLRQTSGSSFCMETLHQSQDVVFGNGCRTFLYNSSRFAAGPQIVTGRSQAAVNARAPSALLAPQWSFDA